MKINKDQLAPVLSCAMTHVPTITSTSVSVHRFVDDLVHVETRQILSQIFDDLTSTINFMEANIDIFDSDTTETLRYT